MLDFDLAGIDDVETRVLNQSVKRNIRRFPEDFMFQLTSKEWESISSQFVTRCLQQYVEDIFKDQNDINEDTRMQLELISQELSELQAKQTQAPNSPRRRIGYKTGDADEFI